MIDLTKPIFGNWMIDDEIGSGAYGTVYRIKRENFGKVYYSALKVVRIPQSDNEIKDIISEFGDMNSVSEYYTNFVQDFAKEIELMTELKGCNNIVSIEDHEFIQNENGIGWTVLIKMELLKPFSDYEQENTLTEKDIVRLGEDVCCALEICNSKNIIHRDIKPDNIFVSLDGNFKLGDFGIARELDKTMGGLSKKGTYTYMAPEVYKGEAYNKTVDIYSLGMVMYRLLNKNRGPFLPKYPEPIKYHDREVALNRRMKGETIPDIDGISDTLNRIVLKACAYNPKERYQNVTDLKEDLNSYLLSLNDTKATTEVSSVKEKKSINTSKEKTVLKKETEKKSEKTVVNNTDKSKKGRNKKLTGILAVVSVVVIVCTVIAFMLNNHDDESITSTNTITSYSTTTVNTTTSQTTTNVTTTVTTTERKKITPDKVQGLKVTSTGSNSVTLEWSSAKNASEYHVFEKRNGSNSPLNKTTSTSITIKNLKPNTEYILFVQAKNTEDDSWGEFSDTISVKTKSAPVTSKKYNTATKSYKSSTYREMRPDEW